VGDAGSFWITGTTSRYWRRKGGKKMRLLTSFIGKNRDFRAWLAAGMPSVASLAEYREKKKTAKRPKVKPSIRV
jgi:hypothetical protein